MPYLFLPIVSIVIHISVLFTKYHFQNKQEYRLKPHSNIHAILLSFQGIEILYQFCAWCHRIEYIGETMAPQSFRKLFIPLYFLKTILFDPCKCFSFQICPFSLQMWELDISMLSSEIVQKSCCVYKTCTVSFFVLVNLFLKIRTSVNFY
jgi:hypothetical protein